MGTKIEIEGVPIEVVSDEEAAKAAYVVCMPVGESPFDDNEILPCCECGFPVMSRPHNPKNVPKICIHCVTIKLEANNAPTE